MRAFPELMIMIQGMVAAGRSVTSTLVLLLITLYVFAIVFKQMFGDLSPELYPAVTEQYGSLGMSSFYLFMGGTLCDDITGRLGDLREETGLWGIFLFSLYVLISAFTVLNMLIGVLCEVVTATAEEEGRKAKVSKVQEMIGPVFDEIDQDGTRTVSRKEFEQLSAHESVREAFEEIGIEIDHVVALADTLFEPPVTDESVQNRARTKSGSGDEVEGEEEEPSKELSFEDFVELLVRTRPDNKASVMDLADLRQVLRVMVRGVDVRIGAAQYELGLKASSMSGTDSEVGRLLAELDQVVTECEHAFDSPSGIENAPPNQPLFTAEKERAFDNSNFDNSNFDPDSSPTGS
jgi:hypothetical protein